MIELRDDMLYIAFPEVHPEAKMSLAFQRTLRIPDDGKTYPLPPGLGKFPVRHVDDYERVPSSWRRHGGVMLPLYQSEALWLHFSSPRQYPIALKVAAGKINAVTGEEWEGGLGSEPQNYLVVPKQPWLDGYSVERGTIRQFVAMPMGTNYSPEAQLTGREAVGGLQIEAFPLGREAYERHMESRRGNSRMRSMASAPQAAPAGAEGADMSLGMGGSMHQEIAEDDFDLEDWETSTSSRCFVHLCNSMLWREITGDEPPTTPFSAREYEQHGLPWFDYYVDGNVLDGSAKLGQLDSIREAGDKKGVDPIPDNGSVEPKNVVDLSPDGVRDGDW
jgi:hypothetical protein